MSRSNRFPTGLLVIVCLTAPVLAQQTVIPDYKSARSEFFWAQLYRDGGESLYCGRSFGTSHNGLNIEHVLPASAMKEAGGCASSSRKECRRRSALYNFMEADLHNHYPAIIRVNEMRASLPFGEVAGEDSDFGECDFEISDSNVEPRPEARGEVARAVFYMMEAYGVRIDANELQTLTQWHRDDPPSDLERLRNERIESLQGTRNPFIDDPSLLPSDTEPDEPEPDTADRPLHLHYECHCTCLGKSVIIQVDLGACKGQTDEQCEIGGQQSDLMNCRPVQTDTGIR